MSSVVRDPEIAGGATGKPRPLYECEDCGRVWPSFSAADRCCLDS